jgi:hypothetical protein
MADPIFSDDIGDAANADGFNEVDIDAALNVPDADDDMPPVSDDDADAVGAGGAKKSKRPVSQATLLAKLAIDSGLRLYHDGDQRTFAEVPVNDHWELMPTRGGTFTRYLTRLYWQRFKSAVNAEAKQGAVAVLESQALFDGERIDTHIRVAAHDGAIYLDLCNENWQVVEITRDGWTVRDDSPVRFRRAPGMLAIPMPIHGGSVAALRAVVNMPDDGAWALALSWLVAALRPDRPCPVKAVTGEQGSAKTTYCKMARALIDPNTCDLRAEPKDVRDLMIAANNSHVVGFDNLSGLPGWMSDAICRLVTGGGFTTRELYSDEAERLFSAKRPVIINGIEDVGSRPDLLDRCICIHLPTIPDDRRQPEADLWAAFEAARPGILGALLDAVAIAMRRLPTVKLDALPRMADFARWAVAAEPGLGLPTGAVMAAYGESRTEAVELGIEASPVGAPLLDLVRRGAWSGTPTELLAAMDAALGEKTKRPTGWPKGARAMGGAVKRLAPNLRRMGVAVDFEREAGGSRRRLIHLRAASSECTGETSSRPSQPSQTGPHGPESGDSPGRFGTEAGRSSISNRPAESGPDALQSHNRDGRDERDAKSRPVSAAVDMGEWGAV